MWTLWRTLESAAKMHFKNGEDEDDEDDTAEVDAFGSLYCNYYTACCCLLHRKRQQVFIQSKIEFRANAVNNNRARDSCHCRNSAQVQICVYSDQELYIRKFYIRKSYMRDLYTKSASCVGDF